MLKISLNHLISFIVFILALFYCFSSQKILGQTVSSGFRAPAYPLVTIDPYTSAWSTTDRLFDDPVRHWTGKVHPLIGAIRVDGHVYRFLGKEDIPRKTILPMANEEAWDGKYVETEPIKGWEQKDFNSTKRPTCATRPKVSDSRSMLTRFMDETRIEGNGIASANPRRCQVFIEAKEVKPLFELATETLFSKKTVSA